MADGAHGFRRSNCGASARRPHEAGGRCERRGAGARRWRGHPGKGHFNWSAQPSDPPAGESPVFECRAPHAAMQHRNAW